MQALSEKGEFRWLLLCAVLGNTACPATHTELKASSPSGPVSLVIRSPDTGEADSTVAYGAALRTSDRFLIDVSVREPLYLYVEQRTDAGIAPLLPPTGEQMQAAEPGVRVLIPPSGFLNMAGQPGTVWIFAVAASQRLSVDQARAEIDKVASAAERESTPAAGRSMAAWGNLDARGIGVLQFKLVHRY